MNYKKKILKNIVRENIGSGIIFRVESKYGGNWEF